MKKKIPTLMIAGTASGVGKTSVSLGLMKALRDKGLKVQAFKVGPDYLDPLHHTQITGRPSRNLDSWMAEDHLEEIFEHGCNGADIAVIEGVMGLYDGLAGDSDCASSCEVAKKLGVPVVLVADAKAMARSFAAVVHGFSSFDSELNLAGVIANRVSGPSHFEYLKKALEHGSRVPLLGYLSQDESISIPDRHLGLMSSTSGQFKDTYNQLGKWIDQHLNIEKLIQLAQNFEVARKENDGLFANHLEKPICRVGIAKDDAFHFYYEDNIDLLRKFGAEIVEFSPLKDKELPAVDLLYLGGGYPEVHAHELSANISMMQNLHKFSGSKPIFAECGGMILLCKALESLEAGSISMAGVFDCTIKMTGRRRALGYVEITTLTESILGPSGTKARGHEFHYSEIQSPGTFPLAYRLRRPVKKTEKEDGYCRPHVVCGYAHFHFASNPIIAKNLVKAASIKARQAR